MPDNFIRYLTYSQRIVICKRLHWASSTFEFIKQRERLICIIFVMILTVLNWNALL